MLTMGRNHIFGYGCTHDLRAIAKDRNVSSTPPPWLGPGLGLGVGLAVMLGYREMCLSPLPHRFDGFYYG